METNHLTYMALQKNFSDDEGGGIAVPEDPSTSNPERGMLVSFPFLKFADVELSTSNLVSIIVGCDQCKSMADMSNTQPPRGETAATTNAPTG